MYKIYLDGVLLPVLPEKLTEKCGREYKTYNVLASGEVVKPGRQKLKAWEFSSVLESGGQNPVSFYKEKIESLADSVKPFNFMVNRICDDGSFINKTNTPAIITDYSFEDREGEPGDLYYTIKIMEYKEFQAKVLAWK